jgi:hypothetical protein
VPALPVITVGPARADVVGAESQAIQIAIDAVAFRGGGTVRVLPGTYTCSDAVHVRSNVRLLGDRERTVLRLAPIVMSPLAVDADIGQKQITPAHASGFRAGMGIVLRDASKRNSMACRPLTVIRVHDNTLYTDDYVTADYGSTREGLVVNYFPLIHGYGIENAIIDGFTVDARPDKLDGLSGTRSAAVHLGRSKNCVIRNVTANGALGDGISFWESEHITVDDCETAHNTEYGIHPGSHAPWAAVRRCDIHHNGSDGLYLCWGVREGVFEKNTIHHNGHIRHRSGVSIGHKDTDNLIARNHIYENHKHGICFRVQTEANGAHRNVFRENTIENNGCPADQVPERLRQSPRYEVQTSGVQIRGIVHDLTFERNIIRETRQGDKRRQYNAFYLDKGVSRVKLVDNEISDHPGGRIVDESGSPDNDLQGDT